MAHKPVGQPMRFAMHMGTFAQCFSATQMASWCSSMKAEKASVKTAARKARADAFVMAISWSLTLAPPHAPRQGGWAVYCHLLGRRLPHWQWSVLYLGPGLSAPG